MNGMGLPFFVETVVIKACGDSFGTGVLQFVMYDRAVREQWWLLL